MKKIKVILAFAFGAPRSTLANRQIAIRAILLANGLRAEVITQDDVPINGMGISIQMPCSMVKHPGGKFLSTLGIIHYGIEEFCRRHNLNNKDEVEIHVVAVPSHMKRCVRDIKKEGFKNIRTSPFKSFPRDSWFTKESTQWWTRSWWLWWLREIPLRLLPWWLYKKKTL